jgi:cell division protein FtsL
VSGQPSFSTTTIIFLIVGIIIGAGVGNYFTTNSLRIVINDYKLQVSDLTEEVSNLSQEVSDLQVQQTSFENQISILETQLSELDEEKTTLETEISDREHSILDLEHEIGALSDRLGDRLYYKTYSDHEVYFEYPSIHDLTIRNETDEIGVIFSFEQSEEGEFNYFSVVWSSPENITSIDEALDSLIALLEPDMKYQYFTAPDIEGFTMNGINAFWHCENSNRDFNVEYYSNQQDTLADFYHLIESFECHSPEN